MATLYGHKDWVTAFVMPKNGTALYSASADCTIRAWQVPHVHSAGAQCGYLYHAAI